VEKRSLVISIDGAARGNSNTDPNSRASYGVYFGKASPHNRCGCLKSHLPQTSSRAEIEAAIQAVEMIAQLDLRGERTTKVVIKTDSDYLLRSMTEWMYTWINTGGIASSGQKVKHWQDLLALHERILEVEHMKRIRVQFWWVPRAYNQEADALANRAFDQEDSAYGSN
jgi:ribonuclease HI